MSLFDALKKNDDGTISLGSIRLKEGGGGFLGAITGGVTKVVSTVASVGPKIAEKVVPLIPVARPADPIQPSGSGQWVPPIPVNMDTQPVAPAPAPISSGVSVSLLVLGAFAVVLLLRRK